MHIIRSQRLPCPKRTKINRSKVPYSHTSQFSWPTQSPTDKWCRIYLPAGTTLAPRALRSICTGLFWMNLPKRLHSISANKIHWLSAMNVNHVRTANRINRTAKIDRRRLCCLYHSIWNGNEKLGRVPATSTPLPYVLFDDVMHLSIWCERCVRTLHLHAARWRCLWKSNVN